MGAIGKKISTLLLAIILLVGVAVTTPIFCYADNAYLQSTYVYDGNERKLVKHAFANVAAAQTDSSIVAAVATKRIKVLGFIISAGATATAVTFNSKPGGAGTAISPLFTTAVNTTAAVAVNALGYFKTAAGEGLTVTTGAGSTMGILVTYIESDT